MLGFLPRLYPDELLYSWLARYHLYLGNQGPKQTAKDLFGKESQIATPDLPLNLNDLYKRVKHFISGNDNDLLEKHTFFLYYTCFLSTEIRETVRQNMLFDSRKTALHMLTGVMASGIVDKKFFQYCPQCVEEDIRNYGETYWHLNHQLPGILVCTKHYTLLNETRVPFRSLNRHEYVPALPENCPVLVPLTLKTYTTKTIQRLFEIANDLSSLITPGFLFDIKLMQKHYRYLLQAKGFANVNGIVDQKVLAEQFRLFYGDECLCLVQSQVDYNKESCWLKEITRKHRKAFHPIRHVLFIHFLGERLETLQEISELTYQPFGPGPYPCLNRAAEHYLKPVIDTVEITICSKTRRPVGTFRCSCEFIYSRKGPDQTEEDRFKIGRIKQFGTIWNNKLYQLIHIEKQSYRAAARELGVDTKTVIHYSDLYNSEPKKTTANIVKSIVGVEAHRTQWLELMTENTSYSVTQLRKQNPSLYTWLYRNDHEWLQAHSPTLKCRKYVYTRVDWQERDRLLARNVYTVARNLLQKKPPVRISLSKVGNYIRQRAILEKHLDKLPLTQRVLNGMLETVEQYQIRRINWAVQYLLLSGEEVQEWRVQRLAGLGNMSSRVKFSLKHVITKVGIKEGSAIGDENPA